MLLRGGLLIELDPPRAALADLRLEDDSIIERARRSSRNRASG